MSAEIRSALIDAILAPMPVVETEPRKLVMIHHENGKLEIRRGDATGTILATAPWDVPFEDRDRVFSYTIEGPTTTTTRVMCDGIVILEFTE